MSSMSIHSRQSNRSRSSNVSVRWAYFDALRYACGNLPRLMSSAIAHRSM